MDREIPSAQRRKKYYKWVALGLVVVLLLIVLQLFVHHLIRTAGVKRADILTAKVVRGDLEGSFTADGVVTPVTSYRIEASMSGKIEQVLHKVGDRVKTGDALVIMSNDDLQLSLIAQETAVTDQVNNLNDARILANQSKLSLRRQIVEARNAQARAKRLFNTQQRLYDGHYISNEDFQTAKEDYDYAQTNYSCLLEEAKADSVYRLQQIEQQEQSVDRIKLNLDQVRSRVSGLTIRAPLDGVITDLNVNLGQMIGTGTDIATVEDSTHYYIQANIDQFYLPRLKEGNKARFTDNAGEHWLTIAKIHPKLSGEKAIVDLNGDLPPSLKSGQTISLDVISSTLHNVLILPLGQYLNDTGSQWVFALSPGSHKATRRTVSFGARSTREVEIVSGLNEGDEVITSSYQEWLKKEYIRVHN